MDISPLLEATDNTLAAVNNLLSQLSNHCDKLNMEQLQSIIASKHTHLFLSHHLGDIAGMFTLSACRLTSGTHVWLEDVVVKQDLRNHGLGKQLIIHAIKEARRLYPGATLMLTSRPERKAANHIYSSYFQSKNTNVYILDL